MITSKCSEVANLRYNSSLVKLKAVKLQHENECLTRVDNNDLQAKMKIYEKMGDLFSRGSLFKNAIDCYAKAVVFLYFYIGESENKMGTLSFSSSL